MQCSKDLIDYYLDAAHRIRNIGKYIMMMGNNRYQQEVKASMEVKGLKVLSHLILAQEEKRKGKRI